jgi:hypothetical protein
MLALMPVVALAAACNGVAPTASTDLSSGVSATDEGAVTAQSNRDKSCWLVDYIHLQVVDATKTAVWVEATYKYRQPPTTKCEAPTFTSNVRGLQVDKVNPFRAGLSRSAATTAKITATAPNGVTHGIQVDLGGPGTSDRPTVDNPCKAIDGVTISVDVPPGINGDVILAAKYQYVFSTPQPSGCPIAPTWEATRRGLTVNPKDGFRASIPVDRTGPTIVYVTAPNGVLNKVQF